MTSRRRQFHLRPAIHSTLVALALLAAGLSPVWADFSIKDWQYWRPITLPSISGGEEMVELTLDTQVFSRGARGLADLRVIAGEAEEVLYHLRIEAGQTQQTTRAALMQDLAHLEGQYTTFVADLGENGLLHNEIEVQASNRERDFRRAVEVEGSQDSETWLLLRDDGEIFEFTVPEQGFHSRDTTVAYPESTARYVRVRITNNEDEPLDIAGAVLAYVAETPPVPVEYPFAVLENRVDSEQQTTVVLLDLGASGLPSNSLQVETSARNFYRVVMLEGSNDREVWQRVGGQGAIHAFDTARYVGEDRTVEYSQATYRYLRLTIHNQDNPPLEVSGVRVMGPRHQVLFPVQPGTSYRLYYGNSEATTPSYDLARYIGYLETEDLPVASLGSQQINPSFEEKLPPLTERFPWLLPTVMIGAGVLIALFLLRLVMQVRKSVSLPS